MIETDSPRNHVSNWSKRKLIYFIVVTLSFLEVYRIFAAFE